MKKIAWAAIIVISVLLIWLICEGAGIPAPFSKVKEMALKTPLDEQGRHRIFIELNQDGQQTIFVIGYMPKYGFIGVGMISPGVLVAEYNDQTKKFSVYYQGRRYPAKEVDVIKLAFLVFRDLVKNKLI